MIQEHRMIKVGNLFTLHHTMGIYIYCVLIEGGADLNKKSKSDQSPLNIASFEGKVDIVDAILRNCVQKNCIRYVKMTKLVLPLISTVINCMPS